MKPPTSPPCVSTGRRAVFGLAAAGWLPALAAATPETTRTLSLDEVIARHRDAASRFVDLDGVKLHYKDEGSGPPVLLLHGTFGDLADWDGWVSVLAPALRVLRFDTPGFGLSGPMPNGNYSVDRMLSLIDALMDHLGIERFGVVGASLGGAMAFRYAATRSDRVAAMVLVNSAGLQTGQRSPTMGDYNILMDPQVREDDVRRFLAFIMNDASLITPAMAQRKLSYANVRGRAEEAATIVRLYERGTPERLLGRVRAPSLVMWGSANQALSTQTADAFIAALRRAPVRERLLYPEGGHMLHVQLPRRTADDARRFLLHHLPGNP